MIRKSTVIPAEIHCHSCESRNLHTSLLDSRLHGNDRLIRVVESVPDIDGQGERPPCATYFHVSYCRDMWGREGLYYRLRLNCLNHSGVIK